MMEIQLFITQPLGSFITSYFSRNNYMLNITFYSIPKVELLEKFVPLEFVKSTEKKKRK